MSTNAIKDKVSCALRDSVRKRMNKHHDDNRHSVSSASVVGNTSHCLLPTLHVTSQAQPLWPSLQQFEQATTSTKYDDTKMNTERISPTDLVDDRSSRIDIENSTNNRVIMPETYNTTEIHIGAYQNTDTTAIIQLKPPPSSSQQQHKTLMSETIRSPPMPMSNEDAEDDDKKDNKKINHDESNDEKDHESNAATYNEIDHKEEDENSDDDENVKLYRKLVRKALKRNQT
jgi:hypothetical protein